MSEQRPEASMEPAQDVAVDWMLEKLADLRYGARGLIAVAEREVDDPTFGGLSVLEGIVDAIRRAEEAWRA